MKKVALFALLALVIVSCNTKKHRERVISSDSTHAVFVRPIEHPGQEMYFRKGEITIMEVRKAPTDPTEIEMVWSYDTVLTSAYLPVDTARDAHKKPIYDSAKKAYKIDSAWQKFNPYDKSKVKVTILN